MATRINRANEKTTATKPKKRKRGIVLLVVVSLLALFILMGVAYAIVSMNYKKAGEVSALQEQVGDPPQREMELVLDQIIFDTLGRSSLRFHSLLADLYGVNSGSDGILTADATNLDTPPGLDLTVTPQQQPQVWQFTVTSPGLIYQIPGYYAGRVMTFVTGNAAGHSTRILESAYDPNTGVYAFAVEAIESKGPTNLRPNAGSQYYINGAPFNGAGAGYHLDTVTPANSNMTATYAGSDGAGGYLSANLVALLPHFSGYDASAGSLSDAVDTGGLDETWDAVDFQNMFLAMVPPTAAGGGVPIIPSYHRQELVNYWRNNLPSEFQANPLDAFNFNDPTTAGQIRNWLRTFIFRPMPWEHPNFNGSNPAFDAVGIRAKHVALGVTEPILSQTVTNELLDNLVNAANAPLWDVDNDNDGVPDSIWVDPGLPVITRPDGRRYKRLVAICIKDLDSRINLNAHGNRSQLATDSSGNYVYRSEYQIPAGPVPANFGMMTAPSNQVRGIGFGPAEVDFLSVFAPPAPPPAYADAAARNSYGQLLLGRYASNLAGDIGLSADAGAPGVRDPLSFVKHQGVPNDFSNQFSWYASHPDVWGRGAVVLDVGGQPRTAYMGLLAEMNDTPYELSLSGEENNADNPYTLVELERMLRYHDQDATNLPSRPLALAQYHLAPAAEPPGVIGPSEALRNLFTTHSSYIPSPTTTIPREGRGFANASGYTNAGTGATILDLYYARLQSSGLVEPALSNEFRKIVPWEFMHGQKFDINRWLGDGTDSNGDGTPDNYEEAFAGETTWTLGGVPGFCVPVVPAQHSNGLDVNSDGAVNGMDRYLARQLYARHLFCLAAMMVPSTFQPACPHETLTVAQSQRLMVRRLAQWAINCVEFRDQDSVMTAFEYDINPTNGWSVDGNPATDGSAGNEEMINGTPVFTTERELVWGMEYPDLLISETLAFHDRRVKDTDRANSGSPDFKRTDMPMPDNDLDQLRVPQGSLFIELYCPRNSPNRNPHLPRELYDVSVPANPRLNLAKLAPGNRPVWRLAISQITKDATVEPTDHPRQPFEMAAMPTGSAESASYDPTNVNLLPPGLTAGKPNGPLPIERYVWFANASTAGITAPEINNIFYNRNGTALNAAVQPGQYVVVGPRATTYLGSQDPANDNPDSMLAYWGGNSPQYITMTPTTVVINDTNGTQTSPNWGVNVRNCVGIIADQPSTPTAGGVPWTNPWTVGLNITEPLPNQNSYATTANYYREPAPSVAVTAAGATDGSFYDDPASPINDGTGFKDEPEEASGNPAHAGRPVYDRGMQATGTYQECASVILQRLANPNLAYNPAPGTNRYNAAPSTDPYVAYDSNLPINPYISVDWATLDATVFTGEEDTDQTVPAPFDPDDDPAAGRPNGGRPSLPRQRGYQPTAGTPDANFWNPDANSPENMPISGAVGPYFQFDLSTPGVPPNNFGQTLGYVNATVGAPMAAPYLGEPSLTTAAIPQTSPWLTWHNRPFSNPMELFLVPSSTAGRICSELTPGPLGAYIAADPYDASAPDGLRAPFGSLLNLFHTADQSTNPTAASQLCRLMDYVEVPSPYLGAERWFNPAHFATAGTYRPPFNKASRFRDPGRININTIFDDRIWNAACAQASLGDRGTPKVYWPANPSNGFFPGGASPGLYEKIVESRQGYGGTAYGVDPNFGTRFTNPFRSADASDLMPDPGGGGGPDDMRRNRPVDATFLRPDPTNGGDPLFGVRSDSGHDNTERNPYFQYQGFQKLGSVLSAHSNVFAVWMTVGYFEVEPISAYSIPPNPAHPEGWVLGQEIGADSGEVTRHRSFYIIDRSVPACFQYGRKHNTDDCILLRRFIE